MLIERSMDPQFLANTYLVAEDGSSPAFLVDAGLNVQPLLDRGLDVTHVLLTHHHWDHVEGLPKVKERYPDARVLAHPEERRMLTELNAELGALVTGDLLPDAPVEVGNLSVRPLPTPGHTSGMLSLLVGYHVFTGDTLFKNSVGGVRAPGHTSFADIKHSIMERLLKLPGETTIHPGHTDPTTVAEELETNAFVRVWRGLDPEGDEPCTALDEPATLVLLGDDYDGGHKAWVRWPDGADDIVPGSKVQRG